MRKTFTLMIALAFSLTGIAYAQCTPDPGQTGAGIFPTPVTGVPNGEVGVPYSNVFTINVPQDTTIDLSTFFPGAPTVTMTVNFFTIDAFNSLPAGLGYACSPASCSILGGNSGCIEVSGLPTTAGQFVANMTTSLNVAVPASVPFIGGTNQSLPGPLAYQYEINNATSADPASATAFTVSQNYPNPASDFTRISFHTTSSSDVSLEVYSLAGQRMHGESATYASGDHNLDLDVRNLEAGVYFYTLSNGNEKITRRLVVAH